MKGALKYFERELTFEGGINAANFLVEDSVHSLFVRDSASDAS